MVEFELQVLKDLGLQEDVMKALPYAVVGDTWEGSLNSPLATNSAFMVLSSHIVPHNQQLKILFLRIWTQDNGAIFRIRQRNPTAAGQTGTVEAFPVQGSVPPFTPGSSAVRDYPMLEAAGAEVLHGSLEDPIHVLEGSIDFDLVGPTAVPATGSKYSITWWGVEKVPALSHKH